MAAEKLINMSLLLSGLPVDQYNAYLPQYGNAALPDVAHSFFAAIDRLLPLTTDEPTCLGLADIGCFTLFVGRNLDREANQQSNYAWHHYQFSTNRTLNSRWETRDYSVCDSVTFAGREQYDKRDGRAVGWGGLFLDCITNEEAANIGESVITERGIDIRTDEQIRAFGVGVRLLEQLNPSDLTLLD